MEAPFANGAPERVPAYDGIAIGQAVVSHGWLYPYSKSGDTGTPMNHALYCFCIPYATYTRPRNIPAVFPIPRRSPIPSAVPCLPAPSTPHVMVRDLYTQAFRFVWSPLADNMHSQMDFKKNTMALPINKVLVRWRRSGQVAVAPRF